MQAIERQGTRKLAAKRQAKEDPRINHRVKKNKKMRTNQEATGNKSRAGNTEKPMKSEGKSQT